MLVWEHAEASAAAAASFMSAYNKVFRTVPPTFRMYLCQSGSCHPVTLPAHRHWYSSIGVGGLVLSRVPESGPGAPGATLRSLLMNGACRGSRYPTLAARQGWGTVDSRYKCNRCDFS